MSQAMKNGSHDGYGAAQDQLNARLAAAMHDVTEATFAALGFSYRQREHGAEIARLAMLKHEQHGGQPGDDLPGDLTEVICGAFDYAGFPYDRAGVRAEVDRQWADL